MQSLVWNKVGDEKVNGSYESPYNGSPLDLLPCPPSKLLFTYDYYGVNKRTKQYVRDELEKAELCIKRRSIAVENKWTTDKLRQASIGIFQTKILAILDILDKHCYGLTDVNDTIELLYSKIFSKIKLHGNKSSANAGQSKGAAKKENANKDEAVTSSSDASGGNKANESAADGSSGGGGDTSESTEASDEGDEEEDDDESEIKKPLTDREVIHLLCDWATTTKRCGVHRLFYVVFLIKRRQIDLIAQFKDANEAIANVSETFLKKCFFFQSPLCLKAAMPRDALD